MNHRDHLRLAWTHLRHAGHDAASERMAWELRSYAADHGNAGKYHHTLTLAWMRLVAAALREHPRIASFDEFVAAHPSLLDAAAPLRYYSSSRLENGRAGWVDPDLRPLP